MGQLGLGQGDAAFFAAGDPGVFHKFAGSAQTKLGQEAPQTKPGSPEWQQAVDALLRTRVATHQ